MAESVALAVLENLVHLSRQDFPTGYVCVSALIRDDVPVQSEAQLRQRRELRDLSPQSLGDWWLEANASAVLEVASAIVPSEHNYLLNPAHPDFSKITVEPPALFRCDERLFE